MVDSAKQADPQVTLEPARANCTDDVLRAIAIGDLNRKTLGLLPHKAYAEMARGGTLLLARRADEIIGYAAYDLTRHHIRLVHLCVDTGFRRQGIATTMVKFISDRHADYPGIKVSCRRSYGLDPMWIGLGFTPRSEGVGKSGQPLTYYWLDHGHPNLLTSEEVLVRAAIDLNVIRALAEANRPDSRDAQALLDDQLSDRLTLVHTGALDEEITTIETTKLRQRCFSLVSLMERVNPSAHRPDEVRAAVLEIVAASNPGYPETAQDQFDLAHVVDAAAAGVNIFTTSDQKLTQTLGPAVETLYGLRIMPPVDVIIHLDELARAESYRPAALLGTDFQLRLLGTRDSAVSQRFVDGHGGERSRAFQELLKDLARRGHERACIVDPAGEQIAIYCAFRDKDVLEVPLLRLASHTLANTLARQILFQLRQQARDLGARTVRITDAHAGPVVDFAALSDGFQRAEAYVAHVVDVVGTTDDVNGGAALAARAAGVPEPALLRSTMPVAVAAEIERMWWPAKLLESQLPTYVIPIQQGYSRDLLGIPSTLDARPSILALSRDHVYYRSVRGLRMHAPARLLWYMSAAGSSVSQNAAIVGCSQLELVVNGSPEELHQRFRHLGVWTEQQVQAAAGRRGIAQALQFTSTEAFRHPVEIAALRRIAVAHGSRWSAPQSARTLHSPDQFADIYRAGQGLR